MSSKLFLFTRTELALLTNPKTKKIGLTGETWEEAMRFMIKQKFGQLKTKRNTNKKHIGYEVHWLESEEQTNVLAQLPKDVGVAFQTAEFDDEFIDTWIKLTREMIRNNE